jgi:hypothetical protein
MNESENLNENLNENLSKNPQICTFCKQPILPPLTQQSLPYINSTNVLNARKTINLTEKLDSIFYFNNKPYHRSCLNLYKNTIILHDYDNVISVNSEYRMSELINIVDDLYHLYTVSKDGINTDKNNVDKNKFKISKQTTDYMFRLMNIICNHDSDYIQCSNKSCNKLILRASAIIGEKTKLFQRILLNKQSDSSIKPDDKDYQKNGKAYRVLYFCSSKCDGYFSSKLRNVLDSIMTEAHKKVDDVIDRASRNINIFKNSNRSVSEIEKAVSIFEAQKRVRVKGIAEEAKKEVEKVTKEWIG